MSATDAFLKDEETRNYCERNPKKYLARQILLTSVGIAWGFSTGGNFGYSSIIIEQLRNETTSAITSTHQSWIAAIFSFAMIPSTLSVGWLLEKFGRHSVASAIEIVNLLAWITAYFASSYELLLLGRLFGGIYVGFGYATYATYIGEVTWPKYRAFCMTLTSLGGATGVFVIQFLGNYLQWNTVALVFAVFPIYNLVFIFYVRESYIWYINKNNMKKAKETFVWFKGKSQNTEDEFNKAIADVTEPQSYSLLSLCMLFKKRIFIIPFAITMVGYVTSQLSGIHSVVFYTSVITKAITKNENYQYYTIVTINIGRFLGVLLSVILVKNISVKKVLLTSAFILGLLTLSLSLFIYLSTVYIENQVFVLVSLVNLALTVLFFSMGLGPLATVVCGELYPAPIRGIGFSLSASLSSLVLFFLLKITPIMLEGLGVSVTFLIFGCFTLGGISILCLVLPNTKNKTLKDIEIMYTRQ